MLLALFLLIPMQTTTPKVFPYPIQTQKLDNGLAVYAVPTEHKGLVAVYTIVRTGSRNEVEAGKTGFAHFFEHMMFRGTDKYPEQKYNEVLKGMGADSNAFTTDDWTCYHIVAAASQLETILEIESDRFANLKYAEPEFQKEARAVLGEYNKNASSPFLILEETLMNTAFTTHTYKHTTMGFLADIQDMPNQFEYSKTFFDRWYRPENCMLVVVGDVPAVKTFTLAKKYYGNWKKPPAAPITIPIEPAQTEEKRADLSWPNRTLPYLFFGYHVPGFDASSKDGRALDVLSQMLFSESAPLYQELVLEKQRVDLLQGGVDDHRDPTLFYVIARVKEEADLEGVLNSVETAIAGFAKTPPTKQRLDEVKSHLRYRFLRELDSPDAIGRTIGNFLQLSGDITSIDKTFQTLSSLTPEDVQRVAKTYFENKNRTVVTLKGVNQ